MALKKVTHWGSRKALEDEYGVLYSLDEKELIWCENRYLKDYVVREGTEKIQWCGFKDHFEIESLKFPDSLVAIGGWAFENCKKLTSLEIPAGVTKIEERVFKNCDNLRKIKMLGHITSIGQMAFECCYHLRSIEFVDDSLELEEDYHHFYEEDIAFHCGHVRLPEGLISLGHAAFCECQEIYTIELPSTLIEMDKNPFCECPAHIINHSSYIEYGSWENYPRWEKM